MLCAFSPTQSELKKARDKVRELDASVNIERNRAQILQTDLENTRVNVMLDFFALITQPNQGKLYSRNPEAYLINWWQS